MERPSMFLLLVLFAGCQDTRLPANLLLPGQSFDELRARMVDEDIVGGGVNDPRVIQAMRDTPRHEFVPAKQRQDAYYDVALPIGDQQTISAPSVVAYMTEQLDPQPTDKVLEIGTGSGYQAAVLSRLVREVYTIEIVPELGMKAQQTFERLKYKNVFVKVGDGYQGWPDNAPFDKIIVTCSPEKVPQALIDQLQDGGRMIVPAGERFEQMLYLFKKQDGRLVKVSLRPTLFVPMTGQAEQEREIKPDPLHPKVKNGSFEDLVESTGEPVAWCCPRLMTLVSSPDAPDGQRYATFTNDVAGRISRASQGIAVDGRQIHELSVSAMIRAKDVRQGQASNELPGMLIEFFDENRTSVGQTELGPWRGTFAWRRAKSQIAVPPAARDMGILIGLFGGVGEISYDDIDISVMK